MRSNVFRSALLTATMLVAVACSGGGGSPDGEAGTRVTPHVWASGVCTATAEWIDEIAALNAGLQENLDASSLESLRDSTVAYFDDLLASTDRMIERVDAAGVPDVQGGDRAAEHVLTGLATARAALNEARDRAASLRTEDPGRFSGELREIGQDVAASLSDVADSMARSGRRRWTPLPRTCPSVRAWRAEAWARLERPPILIGQLHMGVYWLRAGRITAWEKRAEISGVSINAGTNTSANQEYALAA